MNWLKVVPQVFGSFLLGQWRLSSGELEDITSSIFEISESWNDATSFWPESRRMDKGLKEKIIRFPGFGGTQYSVGMEGK